MIAAVRQSIRRGAVVSTRIRILSLVLITSLAVVAAVTPATAGELGLRGESAWVHSRQAARLGDRRARVLLPTARHRTGAIPNRTSASRFMFGDPFGFGSALVGEAPVGTDPSELAVDPATHTIYVANGNNDN